MSELGEGQRQEVRDLRAYFDAVDAQTASITDGELDRQLRLAQEVAQVEPDPVAHEAIQRAINLLTAAGMVEAARLLHLLQDAYDADHLGTIHGCWTENHSLATFMPGCCPVARVRRADDWHG